jgi:hypothetical protein
LLKCKRHFNSKGFGIVCPKKKTGERERKGGDEERVRENGFKKKRKEEEEKR